MNILLSSIMILIGLFFSICGTKKSDFIIYRLFIAKSKILWGENVHKFYQVIGGFIIIYGIVFALGS